MAVEVSQDSISFHAHIVRKGDDGARSDFESMVTQLVKVVCPQARSVEANPGDWGIDTFVGQLGEGNDVSVWQSKFFIKEFGESQQSQVRDSFKSAVKNAAEQNYVLKSWVLCIPRLLDPQMTQWWDNWKKREQKKNNVVIEKWDKDTLVQKLISPDAVDVRNYFYGPKSLDTIEPEVQELPLGHNLDEALFVRQLSEAGHIETESAKREFFNAELLVREVKDKGVREENKQIQNATSTVHSIWEHQFNESCESNESENLPGLHKSVMSCIRSERSDLMPAVSTNAVHACGLMHLKVENGAAGWVKSWRNIADEHLSLDTENDK